jgi:hypothetical protein
VDLVSLRSQGIVRILIVMRDLSALEKDSDGTTPPCHEVVALLKLNGYKLRYRGESPQYVLDPKFRPYFRKGDGDDEEDDEANEDKHDDQSARAPRGTSRMDVDSTPPVDNSGKFVSAPGVSQVVITPYNQSPVTPRGKELVEQAHVLFSSLIAPMVSPVSVRSSLASGVRTSCKALLVRSQCCAKLHRQP